MQEQSETNNDEENSHKIEYRKPIPEDGASVYELVKKSPPLDLNSPYYYLIFCSHFRETSIVAYRGLNIVGFISAYYHPEKSDTFFIWQVAVDPTCRGLSIAKNMIKYLINNMALSSVNYLETTVTPSNKASEALFHAAAKEYKAEVLKEVLFDKSLFGKAAHEPEILFRIGPLNK